MRKAEDGEKSWGKRVKKEKIVSEIVATMSLPLDSLNHNRLQRRPLVPIAKRYFQFITVDHTHTHTQTEKSHIMEAGMLPKKNRKNCKSIKHHFLA